MNWPPFDIEDGTWQLAEDDVNYDRRNRWPEQKWPRHLYRVLNNGTRIDYRRTDSYGPYARFEEFIISNEKPLTRIAHRFNSLGGRELKLEDLTKPPNANAYEP